MMVSGFSHIISTQCTHDRLQLFISRMRWGLPPHAEDSPHAWNRITKLARRLITSTRGDWKKGVRFVPSPVASS